VLFLRPSPSPFVSPFSPLHYRVFLCNLVFVLKQVYSELQSDCFVPPSTTYFQMLEYQSQIQHLSRLSAKQLRYHTYNLQCHIVVLYQKAELFRI
jgi:hypothetical protein